MLNNGEIMSGNLWCDGAGACLILSLAGLLIGTSGLANGPTLAFGLLFAVTVGVIAGLLILIVTDHYHAEAPQTRTRSPERLLDERFARGELTRQEHLELSREILTGRFIRGELELGDYEDRLNRLREESRGSRSHD